MKLLYYIIRVLYDQEALNAIKLHTDAHPTVPTKAEDRNGINTKLNLQGVQYLVTWAK